jgi:hypothetical protein
MKAVINTYRDLWTVDDTSDHDEEELRRRMAERDYNVKPKLGPRPLNLVEAEKLRLQLLAWLRQR